MDALALGALFRMVRIHRRLRQREVAARAGLSDAIVSRIEHGELESMTHRTVSKVAEVLEIRLDYRARWHGADLDRMAGQDHAELVETVAQWLLRESWQVRPEISFSIWGDRGAVDLLAWLPSRQWLLVIEVKTDVVDVGETLRRLGVERRRAAEIAASVGWLDPASISTALVIADTRTNHRRVAAHRETFRAALPDTGQALRALVLGSVRVRGRAARSVAALCFMPYRRSGSTRPRTSGVQRVRARQDSGRRAA